MEEEKEMKKLCFFVMFCIVVGGFVFADGAAEVIDGVGKVVDTTRDIQRAFTPSSSSSSPSQPSTSPLTMGRYYAPGTSEAYANVTRDGNEYYFEWFVFQSGTWLNPFDTKGTSSGNSINLIVAYVDSSACNNLGFSVNQGQVAGTYNIVNSNCFSDTGGTMWQLQ